MLIKGTAACSPPGAIGIPTLGQLTHIRINFSTVLELDVLEVLKSVFYLIVWQCHKLLTVEHTTYRQFLLGSAYLNQGEEEKAVDLFLSAAGGVPQDTFLTEDLLNLSDTASGR